MGEPRVMTVLPDEILNREELRSYFHSRGYRHRVESRAIAGRSVFVDVYERNNGHSFVYAEQVPLGGLVEYSINHQPKFRLINFRNNTTPTPSPIGRSVGESITRSSTIQASEQASQTSGHMRQSQGLVIEDDLVRTAPRSARGIPVSPEVAAALDDLNRLEPRAPTPPREPNYIDLYEILGGYHTDNIGVLIRRAVERRLTETDEQYSRRINLLRARLKDAEEQNQRMREIYEQQYALYVREHNLYREAHRIYVDTYNTLLLEGQRGLARRNTRINSLTLAELEGTRIVAHDGTFLGRITRNSFDSDSIANRFGTYGSRFSQQSILSKYGLYGSDYSIYSPFNRYSVTPPKIFIDDQEVAWLTVNTALFPRVDPNLLLNALNIER